MAVSEHNPNNVVEAVTNGREVRQNQVNARLVVFREQNATIDDQNLSVDLEAGHVAANLTETTDRDNAEGALCERGRFVDFYRHSVLSSVVVRSRPLAP